MRGPFIAYVDECGDTGIENFDPKNPVFVLCVALYKAESYLANDLPLLTKLKMEHWWHDAVVMHSYKIRKKVPPFQALADEQKFNRLMGSIGAFFESSQATIIAAAIDKKAHKVKYNKPIDPYELSITFCLERAYGHIYTRLNAPNEITTFVFEKRGAKEDRRVQQIFEKVCSGANKWEKQFPSRIVFASKDENITGLQIADLVAYPIARYVESRNPNRKDFKSVSHLIRKGKHGQIEGWGLKIFPE